MKKTGEGRTQKEREKKQREYGCHIIHFKDMA
jgi:hypothetical protein